MKIFRGDRTALSCSPFRGVSCGVRPWKSLPPFAGGIGKIKLTCAETKLTSDLLSVYRTKVYLEASKLCWQLRPQGVTFGSLHECTPEHPSQTPGGLRLHTRLQSQPDRKRDRRGSRPLGRRRAQANRVPGSRGSNRACRAYPEDRRAPQGGRMNLSVEVTDELLRERAAGYAQPGDIG